MMPSIRIGGPAPSTTTKGNSRAAASKAPSKYSYEALNREIEEFVLEATTLRPMETRARETMIENVVAVGRSLWGPAVTICTFGSYATGLSLPTSDVDVCLCIPSDAGEVDVKSLWDFAKKMKDDAGKETSVFADAKTPIVRVFETPNPVDGCRFHCDVSLSHTVAGLEELVASQTSYLESTPVARPLIVTTKAILKMWGLNTVRTGGLSSASVFLFVQRFLEEERVNLKPTVDNLGRLLVELWFHSCSSEYDEGFCLWDPFDPMNDVSAGTFRIPDIQQLLGHTANFLHTLIHHGSPPAAPSCATTSSMRRAMLSTVLMDPRQPLPFY